MYDFDFFKNAKNALIFIILVGCPYFFGADRRQKDIDIVVKILKKMRIAK